MNTSCTKKFPLALLLLITYTSLLPLHADSELDQDVVAATLVRPDQVAPDFSGRTTTGKTLTLSAMKGQVVMLYFFSTTSVPACVAELRLLEQAVFQPLQHRTDFQFIGIGRDHTREQLVKIGGDNKLTFPLVPDPQQELFERYFAKYVPRQMVVRKNGTIAYHASGQQEADGILRLRAILERELAVPAR